MIELTSKHSSISFEPSSFYHIYNRGNRGQKTFYAEKNYQYFLQLFGKYLSPYAGLFCYCLMPDHFHLLIKTHSETDMINTWKLIRPNWKDYSQIPSASLIVSDQLRKLFMAYAKAVNKQELKTGSLFQKNVKRRKIEKEEYLLNTVYYIHCNPAHHGLAEDYLHYKWSSYRTLISNRPTHLERETVLNWFGGRGEFIDFHSLCHSIYSEWLG